MQEINLGYQCKGRQWRARSQFPGRASAIMTGGHSLYEANVVSTLPGHGSDKVEFNL